MALASFDGIGGDQKIRDSGEDHTPEALIDPLQEQTLKRAEVQPLRSEENDLAWLLHPKRSIATR